MIGYLILANTIYAFQSLKIRRQQLHEEIADSIQDIIARERFAPGTQLPSERELAVILGVSADSLASHAKFIEKFDLPFPLLSDEKKEMIQKYGVWQEKKNYGKTYMGIVRTTVIIDKDGIVRKIFPKVKVDGHTEEVLAALDEL